MSVMLGPKDTPTEMFPRNLLLPTQLRWWNDGYSHVKYQNNKHHVRLTDWINNAIDNNWINVPTAGSSTAQQLTYNITTGRIELVASGSGSDFINIDPQASRLSSNITIDGNVYNNTNTLGDVFNALNTYIGSLTRIGRSTVLPPANANLIHVLINHATLPDGIYYSDGTNWIQS